MDGVLDLTPTADSILCKSRKQKGRAKPKAKSTGNDPQDITGDDPQDITEHENSVVQGRQGTRAKATGKGIGKAKGNSKTTSIKCDTSWIRADNRY